MDYAGIEVNTVYVQDFSPTEKCCLAPLTECKPCVKKASKPIMETTMREVNETTANQDKAHYLSCRLGDVYIEKADAARDVFHINPDEAPKTPAEFKQRIADGKFNFGDLKDDDQFRWGRCFDYLQWRSVPADKDGYKKFSDDLRAKFQTATDTIKIGTPAEGLAALREFEAIEVKAQ